MKIKINRSDWLYLDVIIMAIRYFLSMLQLEFSPIVTNSMVVIGIVCMIAKISCTKYGKNEWIVFMISFAFSLLLLYAKEDETFLVITIFIMAMRKSNVRILVKCWTYCNIILFILTIISSIIEGQNIYVIGRYEGIHMIDVERYAFGFSHPNGVLAAFFRIICGIIYLDENKSTKKIVTFELIAIFLYYYTKSRTGLVCITLFLFVCFWIQKTKGKSSESLIPKALLFLEMGAILFDLIAVYTYGKSKALVALDYVLTGRFSLAYRMFDYVDWSLFGTNIQAEQLPFSLDNSLWYVILMQGIILFLLLTILYCWSVWKFGKEKKYLEANIILAFTLYSICENMYSALFLNLGLILACYYLNNEVKQYG